MTVYQQELLSKSAHTIGEELWDIHLSRIQGLVDVDSDFNDPDSKGDANTSRETRKRSQSVGEELWEVHLKRSENLDTNEDIDRAGSGYPVQKRHTDVLDVHEEYKSMSTEERSGMALRNRILPPTPLLSPAKRRSRAKHKR